MRLIYGLLIFLLCFSSHVIAQNINVTINLSDEFGSAVKDFNVKISGTRSKLIYSFSNSLDKNSISRTILPKKEDDSLSISITHMSYADSIFSISSNISKQAFNVKMHVRSNFLKDVNVKGPPIWKRGDTINFRTDAFREGDEKKLKDIIEKLPGFEITTDGRLLYKQKPIDRVRIDNEELFADKVKMMLNSFPSHVIDIVQVQQNQSRNRLLKGLEGNETFLNLTLKKGTIKAGFGDFEIGLGSKGRYTADPVLFSITKGLKAGYLGKINSTGDGVDRDRPGEIKTENEKDAGRLLSANYPLSLINNVPNRYYITNHLFDNSVDISTAISKSLRSKTELTYVHDSQRQSTLAQASYYDGNNYLLRAENNYGNYRPELFNFKQTLKYSPDSTAEIETSLNWFADYSNGIQRSDYYRSEQLSTIDNNIANKWDSFELKSTYTHRTGILNANQTSISFNNQHIDQLTLARSDQWPVIYSLPAADYTFLKQELKDRYNNFSINHRRFLRIRKLTSDWETRYERSEIRLGQDFTFSDSLALKHPVRPLDEGNNNSYLQQRISSGLTGGYRGSKDFLWRYTGKIGMVTTKILENETKLENNLLEFSGSLGLNKKTGKFIGNDIMLEFGRKALETVRIPGAFRPISIESYSRTADPFRPLSYISLNYNINIFWPDVSNNSSLFFKYGYNFSDFVQAITYRDFLSLVTDSLTGRGTNNLYFGLNHRMASLLLNALVEIKASLSGNTFLILNGGQVYRSVNRMGTLETYLKRSFDKKYYLTLNARYDRMSNLQPEVINNGSIQQVSGTLLVGLKQRWSFTKGANIILDTRLVRNNIHTDRPVRFFFIDAEANYKLKKTNLYFTVRAENLANIKSYTMIYNLGDGQRTGTIPMIGKNIFLSLRYEL